MITIFKVNLKDQQRFLLKERGGVDQVISYHSVVRVVNLERKKGLLGRLLRR